MTPSGGGTNLLGGTWTLVPASSGSDTSTFSDGTSVPALNFGAIVVGLYDTYSQTFATTPGAEYVYAFTFFNDEGNEPSGLLVTTSGGSAGVIPEPSTWAMMLIGFAGLGFVGYRRAKRNVSAFAVQWGRRRPRLPTPAEDHVAAALRRPTIALQPISHRASNQKYSARPPR